MTRNKGGSENGHLQGEQDKLLSGPCFAVKVCLKLRHTFMAKQGSTWQTPFYKHDKSSLVSSTYNVGQWGTMFLAALGDA